jgi:hypothetical protein
MLLMQKNGKPLPQVLTLRRDRLFEQLMLSFLRQAAPNLASSSS